MTVNDIARTVTPVLRRHGVHKAAVFGSYARGEATAKSNIDLLVDLPTTHRKDLYA